MSLEQAVVQLEQTNAALQEEVVRFRDATMGLSAVYSTTTEGRQNTADGKYFSVPGNGAYMRLYRRNGSSSSLIAEFPDRVAVEQIANAGFGTDSLQSLTTVEADQMTVSGVYSVNPASDSGYPFSTNGVLLVLGRSSGYATHLLMRQNTNSSNSLYIRQIAAGGVTEFARVWTGNEFSIQSGSYDLGEDSSVPTLMRAGAFGWGTANQPSSFPDPEAGPVPTGTYRDINSTAFNPPSRSAILAMQAFSDSQVFVAVERNSGQMSTFAQNAIGATSARWLIQYNRDNANQPVSFDEGLGLPSGGVIEAGGTRYNGWYIKFLDGTLVCGIHRTLLGYQTSNMLRCRFDFPTSVAQVLAITATPLDPYNFNNTQYSSGFLAPRLGALVQRWISSSYCRVQLGCPSPDDSWSTDDQLKCDIVVWGRWRGELDSGDTGESDN
ncbi:MAG: hypothetical protein ACTHZY_11320 [Halomonas sp.]